MNMKASFAVILNPQFTGMIFIDSSLQDWIYFEPIKWPAPGWLVSSGGRVLHQYRKGHELNSRTGMNIFDIVFITA